MSFCIKCGKKIDEGAKFCNNCGNAVNNEEARRTSYDGEIHKCPNCGEELKAFEINCPACGHELRGTKVSNAIKEFASKLADADNNYQKFNIIRNYPIPNTKEDIFEFMVLASSNIDNSLDEDLSVAWESKIEQAYQKAQLIFENKKELGRIEVLYNQVCVKLNKKRRIQSVKRIDTVISELIPTLPNLIIVFGWLISIFVLLPLCGIQMENVDANGYQLLLMLDFVVGAIFIPISLKCRLALPKLLTTLGIVLSIIILIVANKDSIFKMILMVDIICSSVIFVKMFKYSSKNDSEKINLNSLSFVMAIILTGILAIVYFIGGYIANANISNGDENIVNNIYESGEIKNYEEVYNWPNNGLCVHISQPSSQNGIIEINTDETFQICVYKMSFNEFELYMQNCIDKGFTVDGEKKTNSYKAYNAEGYELYLSYNEKQELYITIKKPIEMGEYEWPKSKIAKSLPKPESKVGKIIVNSSDSFSIYIGDTTIDAFNKYVEKSLKKGFDYDYDRYETSFSGKNKKEDDLSIIHLGNNTMLISIMNWNL